MSHGISIHTHAMAHFLGSEQVKQHIVLRLPVLSSFQFVLHVLKKINADEKENKIRGLTLLLPTVTK